MTAHYSPGAIWEAFPVRLRDPSSRGAADEALSRPSSGAHAVMLQPLPLPSPPLLSRRTTASEPDHLVVIRSPPPRHVCSVGGGGGAWRVKPQPSSRCAFPADAADAPQTTSRAADNLPRRKHRRRSFASADSRAIYSSGAAEAQYRAAASEGNPQSCEDRDGSTPGRRRRP